MSTNTTTLFVLCVILHCFAAKPNCGCTKTANKGKQPYLNQPVCNACPRKRYFSTEPISASQVVYRSPYIVHRLPETIVRSQKLVAQCFTFLPLLSGINLYFVTSTIRDSTPSVDLFFQMNGPFGLGTYWFAGLIGPPPFTPILAVGNIVKELNCAETNSTVFSAVTVNLAAGCTKTLYDQPLVFSTSAETAVSCISSSVAYLKSIVENVTLNTISDKSPIYCVGDLYGIPVVNSESLSSNDYLAAISYPTFV